MGKDKHANRTKGNQKPSSSMRSAELLGGINNTGGFLGFGESYMAPSLLPNDSCVTQDFRLALRKMAKKDAITKIKALQEFQELIETEDKDSICITLPFWPRLYCKLSVDIEKKVRSSVQVCHGHLAAKVGKQMAPHLRSLMPSWLLAMCDPYTAAATAARNAFQTVFSEDKRPGVLFHCCKEIVDYIADNLFRQTADTLSDPKTTSAIEREEKYMRVVSSSLDSVSMLQQLTQDHPQYSTQVLPALQDLLHNKLFWKLHKHAEAQVRSSLYECVSHVASSGGCDVVAACLAVRPGLSDSDASVLPHAYAALLHLAAAHPEVCWRELGCSSSKPVSERLLRLLSEQCRGVAVDVAPLLLPLLSVLPRSALANPALFYSQLLQAITNNVLQCATLQSRQEVAVLQQTLFEVLRLLTHDPLLDRAFWTNVLTNMVGPVVLLAVRSAKQLDSGTTFEAVTALSQYWARRVAKARGSPAPAALATPGQTSSKNDTAEFTQELINFLWGTCFDQCEVALKDANSQQLNQLCLFLNTIKNPKLHTNSKKSGVKFSDSRNATVLFPSTSTVSKSVLASSPDSSPTREHTTSPTTTNDPSRNDASRPSSPLIADNTEEAQRLFSIQFDGNSEAVMQLVTNCHQLYSSSEDTNVKLRYLKLLTVLLSVFKDLSPYRGLLASGSSDDGSCCSFVLSVVVPELSSEDYSLQCVLAEMLHTHLLLLQPNEQTTVLAAVLGSSSVEGLRAVLQQLQGAPLPPAVCSWLVSAPLGARLVSLLKRALALNIALAYERQDIAKETQGRGPAKKGQEEEEVVVEVREEESVVAAQAQREHLVALLQLVLAAQVTPDNIKTTTEFQFNSSYISQILVVLHTSLPSQLHVEHHEDSASSTLSNVQLVLQLASTVFRSSNCWTLNDSYQLLQALFMLLCPADLLLCPADDENQEVTDSSILPERVTDELRQLVLQAFTSLVSCVAREEPAGNVRPQYQLLLQQVFEHFKCQLGSSECSYTAAAYLADLSCECLQIIAAGNWQAKEDWDIPLDQQGVRDAFDLLLPSEGCWAQWEALMSPVYLAPSLLLGSGYFRSFPLPRNMKEAIAWDDSYTRMALFLSSVLTRICSSASEGAAVPEVVTDSSSTQGNVERTLALMEGSWRPTQQQPATTEHEQDQISLGPYCRLACVCVHASYYLESMVTLTHALNLSSSPPVQLSVVDSLNNNTKALLQKINCGNLQQLCQIVRDVAAASETGLWCVTLQLLLAEHQQHISVARLLQGLDAQGYNVTAVKQVLLQYLTPEEVVPVLECEVSRLCSLSDDPFSGVDVLSVVGSLLSSGSSVATQALVRSTMDTLLHWWNNAPSVFMFAADITANKSSAADLSVVVSVVRVVRVLVRHHSVHLTAEHWERLLCAVVAWVQSLSDSAQSLEKDSLLSSMVCSVSQCVAAIEALMQRLETAPAKERGLYPEKLVQEFGEFFCSFLHDKMLPLFFTVAGWYQAEAGRSVLQYCVCRALSQYISFVPLSELEQHKLPPLHHQQDDGQTHRLPEVLQVLLNHLCGGLLSPHPAIAGSCYRMLERALPVIMTEWCKKGDEEEEAPQGGDDDEDQRPRHSLPYVLLRLIRQCGTVVSVALDDRPVLSGWCVVVPHTDSHTYTLAYLLAWHLALQALMLCDEASRHLYAATLKSAEMMPQLLKVLVKLLPPEHHFTQHAILAASRGSDSMLTSSLKLLTPNECGSSYVVWWLACQLYLKSMRLLPYWVRTWYHSLHKKHADSISAHTTSHFSPIVIADELASIREYKCPDDVVKVRVRSQREVIATYTIDESELELTLQLPPNLPLSPAVMVHSEHAGVCPKLWEGWKNGLKTVLSYRNSPLLASLKVWKQNLDQKYQGVEPCYICYCIMHNTNHTLPSSLCRTCKKKFHSACLYQWFLSSPHSSCPLCRSVW